MRYALDVNVDRITVSMDAELGMAVRQAAEHAGMSVSSWLAEAAASRLRNVLLRAALDAWQAEDGPFTEAELAEAAADMGLPWPSTESAA